jgi:serine/arginine repetitive matrix protein 1
VDAGNSRSYGVPVGYALNNTNFNDEEEKDN